MKIQIGNIQAKVIEATVKESEFLMSYLVFKDPKARYTPTYKAGGWDGNYKLYDTMRHSFPAGLLPLLARGAAKVGIAIEVEDLRKRIEPVVCDLPDLRDYQLAAVKAGLAATRGIVWLPTGSGKTRIMAALAKVVPCKWVVLVDQKDLLNQAATAIATYLGEKVGRIGDGHCDTERVTVGTVQGVNQAIVMRDSAVVRQVLAEAQGIMLDECHVSAANVFQRVVARTPGAYWRFGFSATPLQRGDRRNLLTVAATGAVIYKVEPQALIEQGVLAQPKLSFVKVDAPKLDAHLTWAEAYAQGIVDAPVRNAVVVRTAQRATKPALVFVKEIDHGRMLLKRMREAGLSADFVWGTDTTQQRSKAVETLVRGDIEVLVTSSIFNKGKDIPEVRACIVAAGGKDVILAIQRLGRGMRVTATKATMELWDFQDGGHIWLKRHSNKRRKAYEAAGYEVEVVADDRGQLAIENPRPAA